jgi:hypothetical protein
MNIATGSGRNIMRIQRFEPMTKDFPTLDCVAHERMLRSNQRCVPETCRSDDHNEPLEVSFIYEVKYAKLQSGEGEV